MFYKKMQLLVALGCFHWICFLFLLIFVSFTSHSPILKKGEGWELETAEGFLEKYGYLGHTGNHGHEPAEVNKAVREFQWLSRLPVSGLVDDATLQLMSQPRCGVTDGESHAAWEERVSAIFSGNGAKRRSKRYSQQGEKWYKRHLTYRIVNGPRSLSLLQVRRVVRAAFELWSNVSALAFWEVMEGPADIRLAFYEGEHSDGVTNAFDGPGGALAHAFFPRRGEAHFDISERWTLNSHKGRNLFIVTAHEIGHTLGLEHSPVRNALMSPYYKKLGKDLVLSWDDIAAVQQLYGKPFSGSAVQLPGRVFTSFLDSVEAEQPGTAQQAPYCQAAFDAITMDLNHTVYIFKGGQYWTVSTAGQVSSALLREGWPGLPRAIEAAAVSQKDGKFYFFRGGRCWRYKDRKLEAGFPRKSNTIGLPRHPDSAFYYQPLGRMVVLKGQRYFVLSQESLRVEPYYPRELADWKGVPPGANGVLTRPDGQLYFFKDDRFWRFDPGKLRVVGRGQWASELEWTGCQREAKNSVD